MPSIPSGQTEFQAQKMRIISELQSKWRCTRHSKDHDVYCYSTDGNVCLTLTHGNMSFWALEIVCYYLSRELICADGGQHND